MVDLLEGRGRLVRGHIFVLGLMAAGSVFAASHPDQAVVNSISRTPLAFEKGVSDATHRSAWVARGNGYAIALSGTQATIGLVSGKKTETIQMRFVGANPGDPSGVAEQPLPGKVNYFIGSDPQKWVRDKPTFGRVRYQNVYEGTDVVWYGNQGQLEYDFVLRPGADPKLLAIQFEGAKRIGLEQNGDARIDTAHGQLKLRVPAIYQEVKGERRQVAGHYVLRGENEIVFQLANYDKSRELVIDPTLVYASYYGANSTLPLSVAVDSTGNVYIGGYSYGGAIPTLHPASSRETAVQAGFLAKFDPTGQTLLYSTYLGGSTASDQVSGITVDAAGDLAATGLANSTDFPLVNPAQPAPGGGGDAFVTELNPQGNQIVYSTYLGGPNSDQGNAVAFDSNGNAYVTGQTGGSFPTTAKAYGAGSQSTGAFVVKVANTGAEVYSALLTNGTSGVAGNAITVDGLGAAYIAGTSGEGGNFPGSPLGANEIKGAAFGNVFIADLAASGSALTWTAFLGGSAYSYPAALARDATAGTLYVAGFTSAPDLPVANAVQNSLLGQTNAFAAALTPNGSAFSAVTYLGGSKNDYATGVALTATGLVISGYTSSPNFPGTQNGSALQPSFPGSGDFYKSSNSGSWTEADSGLPNVKTLSPDPANAGALLVLDNGGNFYLTINAAASWSTVGPVGMNITGIARSVNGAIVYGVNTAGVIYQLTNDGASWSARGNLPSGVSSPVLAVVPSDATGNTLIAIAPTAVYRSSDGGLTFSQIGSSGVPVEYPNSFAVPSSDGSIYAIPGNGGVYKSIDGGVTFAQLGGSGLSLVHSFSLDSSAPSTLYAADCRSAYQSVNAGATWTTLAGAAGDAICQVAVAPSLATTVYGSSVDGNVFVSNNSGATWTPYGSGVNTQSVQSLAVDKSSSGLVYLATSATTAGFVTKLNVSALPWSIVWSTYFGGSGTGGVYGVAAAPSGDVWITGYGSQNILLTANAQNSNGLGGNSGFLARISDATGACAYTLTPSSETVYQSGSVYFSLSAPSGCPWTATTPDPWITLKTSASGAGSAAIAANVAANATNVTQTGTITVGGQVFTITEPANSCTYTVGQPALITAAGGTFTVGVTAPAGCPWTAIPQGNIVSVTSGSSGTGDGSITVFVPASNSVAGLTFRVLAAGSQIIIEQGGACAFTFATNGGQATGAAGTGSVAFTASAQTCDWAATSDQAWLTITNTNPFGQGSGTVTYSFTGNVTGVPRIAHITLSGISYTVTQPGDSALQFVPATPCRVLDTRKAAGPFGGPSIAGQTFRSFIIPDSACGIPASAAAYSLNVTVVPQTALGYLTVWPSGEAQPVASTLNSLDARVKANAAIVPAGANGAISIFASNTTDVIVDINGYFVPAGSTASVLAFYPITPCRIADTRKPNGAFGSPSLAPLGTRDFPINQSACGVPISAQAYSLNFTVVPPSVMAYLTVWPAGQTQPLVSTLNDLVGQTIANAAIVPAGTNGDINVFATQQTDLVIDINGYFAPFATGGLSFYDVTPCRVLDTREPSGTPPFQGERTVSVTGSACAPPATAQGFVLNATAVPPAPLGYLTLWPDGGVQPLVSTLNSIDGAVTDNMAIVPTTNGSIDIFASNPTHLVLDLFGYFAP